MIEQFVNFVIRPPRLLYGAEDPSIAGMVLDSAFSNLYDLMMELVEVYKIRVPKFTVKMAVQYMRRVIQRRAKFDIMDLNVVQFPSTCSDKFDKYYNLGAFKGAAGTNESLLYEIINGLRAAGTDAGSSSAATTNFTNATKSVVELLTERVNQLSVKNDNDLDFLLDENHNLTEMGGNTTECHLEKIKMGLGNLEATFETLVDAFVFLDKNKDGYVSKDEMIQAINETTTGERSSGRIAMKRFEEMDWDKNGMVSFKEFLFAFTRWVGIDENEDDEE
nr:unnamed protein product [Digitaria exilis]